jgi:hypothetical protein
VYPESREPAAVNQSREPEDGASAEPAPVLVASLSGIQGLIRVTEHRHVQKKSRSLSAVERPPGFEGERNKEAYEGAEPYRECSIAKHDDRRHRLDGVTWAVRDREDH